MSRTLVAVALGFCVSIPVHAQTASLSGSVVDESGGVVMGAVVQLTGPSIHASVTSGLAGDYAFRALAPGTYQITVIGVGFKGDRASIIADESAPSLVFSTTAGGHFAAGQSRVSPDITASRLHSWEAVMRGGHVLAAVLLISAPAAARAQTAAPPVYFVGGLYDAHTRATAEGGVLVPFHVNDRGLKGEWGQNGKFVDCRCLEALAGVGTGGARLAIGPAFEDALRPLFWVGADVLLTVVRTFDSPNAARPNTTYAGVEGGVMFMGIRARVGVAHAVSGRGRDGTVVTGNIGLRWQW